MNGKTNIPGEETMMKYLLGELSEEEEITVEDRYVLDGDFFNRLLVAEDELIDSYVRGELTEPQKRRFEKHFLSSPKRKERLRSAQALMRLLQENAAVAPQAVPETGANTERVTLWQRTQEFLRSFYPGMQLAMSAAMLLLIIGGGFIFSRLNSQINQLKSDRATLQSENEQVQQEIAQTREASTKLTKELENVKERSGALEQQVASLQEPKQAVVGVTFEESFQTGTGTADVGGRVKAVRTTGKDQVKVQINLLEADYQQYRIKLLKDGKDEIWQTNLSGEKIPSGKRLTVRLSTDLLKSGDYKLIVSGKTDDGNYQFIKDYTLKVSR
jgi:anti-sigma factor RsiW